MVDPQSPGSLLTAQLRGLQQGERQHKPPGLAKFSRHHSFQPRRRDTGLAEQTTSQQKPAQGGTCHIGADVGARARDAARAAANRSGVIPRPQRSRQARMQAERSKQF